MAIPEIPLFPRASAWLRATAADIQYDFHPLHAFTLLGLLLVLYAAERALDLTFFHFATPAKPLPSYRRRGPRPTYALVAGAQSGTGLGIARALTHHGYGVILLDRDAAQLSQAASSLRESLVLPEDADPAVASPDEYVKVVVLDPATATPDEMEDALRGVVVDGGLRVSILVNCTAELRVLPRPLASSPPEDVDDGVAARARFPARLTTLMLPVLAHRGAGVDGQGMSFGTHRRSLILNVGSSDMLGVPYSVLGGATAAFMHGFSNGLARELEMDPATRHIDVLAVLTGEVTEEGPSDVSRSRWTPDADTVGRWVVEKTDGAVGRGWRDMRPYWLDHLRDSLQSLKSEKAFTRSLQRRAKVEKDSSDALDPAKPKDE